MLLWDEIKEVILIAIVLKIDELPCMPDEHTSCQLNYVTILWRVHTSIHIHIYMYIYIHFFLSIYVSESAIEFLLIAEAALIT